MVCIRPIDGMPLAAFESHVLTTSGRKDDSCHATRFSRSCALGPTGVPVSRRTSKPSAIQPSTLLGYFGGGGGGGGAGAALGGSGLRGAACSCLTSSRDATAWPSERS